jgi:pimeloyl-ACP methyl ester carboxylesterase
MKFHVSDLLFVSPLAAALFILPEPSGKFSVGSHTMELIDRSRLDPYALSPRPRAVMVSAYFPVAKQECKRICQTEYAPPATVAALIAQYTAFGVPTGIFEQFRLQMCCEMGSSRGNDTAHKSLLLFSPGAKTSRLLYGAMAQSIASTGYIVVTIDHPYDADVVEFPDNSIIFASNITENRTTLAMAVDTRAHDATFVLSRLSDASVVSRLIPGAIQPLDIHSTVIFGHSLGGATALAAMELDPRIKGGINMDGSFHGPETTRGTDRAFAIFGNTAHNRSSDASWAETWPNLRGWKRVLQLRDSGHNTFTDIPLLAKAAGFTPFLPPVVLENIGSLDGSRALQIVSTYVTAFADFVLFGKSSEIWDGPSSSFPEVVFDP